MLPPADYKKPQEVKEIIANIKAELSKIIPSNIDQIYQDLIGSIKEKTRIIKEQEKQGKAIPIIESKDIFNNSVDKKTIEEFKDKGVVVIRNVIDEAYIKESYNELKEYIKSNNYDGQEVSAQDNYFAELKSAKPQIYDLFWSKCQVNIRQHENVLKVKQFINKLWKQSTISNNFDFDKDYVYADRVRVRKPGDSSLGLSPHIDGGSLERWLDDSYRKIYQDIYTGSWRNYDPYNANHRDTIDFIKSPAVCTAFRTFQGWIALTKQGPTDGTLQVVPMLKEATAYLLLRPFLNDIPEDVLCGASAGRVQNISKEFHQPLLEALVSVPQMYPGDTIWWHCDGIHAVEDEHQGTEESSVTYIGPAPHCLKNNNFVKKQKELFIQGKSPQDFAPMDRETSYNNRATELDLTSPGKEQMGF